jgi:hypothetical protein
VVLLDQIEVPRRFGRVNKANNQQEASRIMKPLLQYTQIIPEPKKQSPGSCKFSFVLQTQQSPILVKLLPTLRRVERKGKERREEERRGEERTGEERRGNLTTCWLFLV